MEYLKAAVKYCSDALMRWPLEALLWLAGLAMLALMDPHGTHLFSLCPFSWFFEQGCLGCGLGHGIAFLVRGEWQASWEAHPLAAPAMLLLLWRSGKVLYLHRKHHHYTSNIKTYGTHPSPDAGPGAG